MFPVGGHPYALKEVRNIEMCIWKKKGWSFPSLKMEAALSSDNQ
jgi:hypothetical protein